jgi:DivIVA domain-containing protein
MTLDRQSIEKRDFPIGRRGYDPEAVDAHLAKIASEVEELKLASHQRTETVAASAGERVRAIVEAAELSAAEIERQAVEEAREIRAEAAEDSHAQRSQATSQARDYVGRVSTSTTSMIQRLDAMQSELATLLETLRTGSNRLNADLQLLEGNLVEVRGAVLPNEREEGEEASAAEPTDVSALTAFEDAPRSGAGMAAPASASSATPLAAAAGTDSSWPAADPEVEGKQGDALFAEAEESPGGGDDIDGARLIALNMALDGTSREETARYLSAHYRLLDPEALLDEVYSSVQS